MFSESLSDNTESLNSDQMSNISPVFIRDDIFTSWLTISGIIWVKTFSPDCDLGFTIG